MVMVSVGSVVWGTVVGGTVGGSVVGGMVVGGAVGGSVVGGMVVGGTVVGGAVGGSGDGVTGPGSGVVAVVGVSVTLSSPVTGNTAAAESMQSTKRRNRLACICFTVSLPVCTLLEMRYI
jgi:hypothetical protein